MQGGCRWQGSQYLGQGEDGHLVLGIVGQILVKVRQAGWVSAQLVIHHPQLISRRHLPTSLHSME